MLRIKNCGITMRRFKQLLAFALVFLVGFQLLNLMNANFSKCKLTSFLIFKTVYFK